MVVQASNLSPISNPPYLPKCKHTLQQFTLHCELQDEFQSPPNKVLEKNVNQSDLTILIPNYQLP